MWVWPGVPPTPPPVTPELSPRNVITRQELPQREWQGYQFVQAGVPPPSHFVVPPLPSHLYNAQEQPDHPLPKALPGVPPPSSFLVKPLQTVATTQEAPDHHPSRWAKQGVHPLISTAGFLQPILTTQEYPEHPNPSATSAPHAFLPQLLVSHIFNKQEEPFHPLGWARLGVPPLFIVPTFSIIQTVSTKAEPLDHPSQSYAKGNVPVQTLRRHVIGTFEALQELPDHPNSSIIFPPVPPIFVPPPPSRPANIFTKQEAPDEPPVWARRGLPPRSFSRVNTVLTLQEQPDFTPGWSRVGIQSPRIVTPVPPVNTRVFTRQEEPFHPGSLFVPWPTVHGKPAIPPITPIPATYYMLEDHWINEHYLQAGTIQKTADLGGNLPINWVPSPNVDPVDANAVAAYTAAGYRPRGLIRMQYSNLPVNPPVYNWRLVNGVWVLVKG